MLALTAAFYAFPAWHLVLWSALALSSAGAIIAGTIIYRPSHPIAWWLLAPAIPLFASGDATYIILTTWLGQDNPFPSLADVFYLAMYPIAAAGLVILVRQRSGGRDKGSVLDALSVTTRLSVIRRRESATARRPRSAAPGHRLGHRRRRLCQISRYS